MPGPRLLEERDRPAFARGSKHFGLIARPGSCVTNCVTTRAARAGLPRTIPNASHRSTLVTEQVSTVLHMLRDEGALLRTRRTPGDASAPEGQRSAAKQQEPTSCRGAVGAQHGHGSADAHRPSSRQHPEPPRPFIESSSARLSAHPSTHTASMEPLPPACPYTRRLPEPDGHEGALAPQRILHACRSIWPQPLVPKLTV